MLFPALRGFLPLCFADSMVTNFEQFPEPFHDCHRPSSQRALGLKNMTALVAPYCAITRDYLSPLLRAMGVLVSQHGQLGAIPPTPFLSVSPWEHAKWRCNTPPPTKGVSQRYLRDALWEQAKQARYPLCDSISKGYCAIGGGGYLALGR